MQKFKPFFHDNILSSNGYFGYLKENCSSRLSLDAKSLLICDLNFSPVSMNIFRIDTDSTGMLCFFRMSSLTSLLVLSLYIGKFATATNLAKTISEPDASLIILPPNTAQVTSEDEDDEL